MKNKTDIWENSQWIWKHGPVSENEFVYFRRSFQLRKLPEKAQVQVSAHNHLILYLNGVQLTGYVTPAPSHPQKSKFYLTYDVTSHLQGGENVFSAVVHYLGSHGQNYVDGLPGFLLEAQFLFPDGTRETLGTDESWRAEPDTPFRNGTSCQQRRHLSAVEVYDARKEPAGWKKAGFVDSHWAHAGISPIQTARWNLVPQEIPEGAVHELIQPMLVEEQKNGLQIFDAGKIVTGWIRMALPGIAGTRIRFRYSEDLVDGRVGRNVCNEFTDHYYDEYVMAGGTEIEEWEPNFSYKAFRYVEVEGYPQKIQPGQILVVSAGTGIHQRGSFRCGDQMLNRIYDACIQTQKNNVVGQMVDCPHREQAQYLADADWQAETYVYNFEESSVLRKVLLDFRDAQYPDGRLPFVFPTNADNPVYDISIPEWDLHYVTLLWKVYETYADLDLLRNCYDTAVRVADHYWQCRDLETGLVPRGPGFPSGWNISDWPYPNISHRSKYLTVQNCLLYHAVTLLGRMAQLLDHPQDADRRQIQAEELKKSIWKHLYSKRKKRFRDGMRSRCIHQGPNVVAFAYGLVPQEDAEAVLEYIADCGFGCSTLLMRMVLQTLFEHGRGERAYEILRSPDQPGWGYMINQGFQTVWEGFRDIESHSHAWNGYPARLMQEHLLGIRMKAPGFRQVEICPFIPADLDFAEGKVVTCRGIIGVAWQKRNNMVQLTVEIPAGVTADIRCGGLRETVCNPGTAPLRETLYFQYEST